LIYFLDASALVKAYVREAGTEDVRKLLRRTLAVSAISLVEVTSAIRRRAREGAVSQPHADAAAAAVRADIREMWMVEARRPVLEVAADLVGRHPLRAYDAVQLASALTLVKRIRAVTFVCSDALLTETARNEGLRGLSVG
jgi:predicted nucleic acid-binding protein